MDSIGTILSGGSGQIPGWGRGACPVLDLKLPVSFANTNAEVLYTVEAGYVLGVLVPWWEVTASWTGGTNSAIGLSSNNASLATQGDLLGGASGDVLAGLTASAVLARGTKGAKIGTPVAVLFGGNTIRFDRIVSAFTAGAAIAHVPCFVLHAP